MDWVDEVVLDWVHRGGPWTGSTGVVHEPGPQRWSMNPGPCFVYVLQGGGGGGVGDV